MNPPSSQINSAEQGILVPQAPSVAIERGIPRWCQELPNWQLCSDKKTPIHSRRILPRRGAFSQTHRLFPQRHTIVPRVEQGPQINANLASDLGNIKNSTERNLVSRVNHSENDSISESMSTITRRVSAPPCSGRSSNRTSGASQPRMCATHREHGGSQTNLQITPHGEQKYMLVSSGSCAEELYIMFEQGTRAWNVKREVRYTRSNNDIQKSDLWLPSAQKEISQVVRRHSVPVYPPASLTAISDEEATPQICTQKDKARSFPNPSGLKVLSRELYKRYSLGQMQRLLGDRNHLVQCQMGMTILNHQRRS